MSENKLNEKSTSVESNTFELKEPIEFDGTKITKIDLSGMEQATTRHLVMARRMMNSSGTSLDIFPERSIEFACYFAAVTTNKPSELFMSLRPVDGMRLKNAVSDFLY